MSRINNNPILKGVRGMLANLIVFREVRGRMIMSNRPKRPSVITPHQQEMKSRFIRAAQYAKRQIGNEEAKAAYAKGINDRKHSAYAVALTDCMTAPSVNAIDVSNYLGVVDDVIIVHATDDFKVTSVQVTIRNRRGEVIEQGAALQSDNEEEWKYRSTATNNELRGTTIIAQATDKPGNVASMKKVMV